MRETVEIQGRCDPRSERGMNRIWLVDPRPRRLLAAAYACL
jgi:hypothetical protein